LTNIQTKTPQMTPQTIGILPIDGFSLLSYASVVEPLRFANRLSGQHLYDLVTLSSGGSHVVSAGPALASVDRALNDPPALDSLFVIAGGRPEEFEDRQVLNWIARIARGSTRIGGVSGGPVILAKAGVLSGHRMTVHWEHAAALMEDFPDLLLEQTLFTVDRNVLTCGGGAAALEMTLALIEDDHGRDLMQKVSDWILLPDRREASSTQRKTVLSNVGRGSAAVLQAVARMEDNVATPMSLEQLSASVSMSGRQLNRLFKRATGRTVMNYYRKVRLDVATNLLRGSALNITQIAVATGFSSSSHFSDAYRAEFGCLPSEARN
jgi:transcriptional regulator GlxA family with amidase domain